MTMNATRTIWDKEQRRSNLAALVLILLIFIAISLLTSKLASIQARSRVASVVAHSRPYVLPAKFSIQPIAAWREPSGTYVSGTANFPDGTKLMVVLGPEQAELSTFVMGGKFRAGPFSQLTAVTGRQPLEILFNRASQNQNVLSILEAGADTNVNAGEKMFDAKFTIALPAVPSVTLELNAIRIVQVSILTIPGVGRSARDVEENIRLFETPGVAGNGWNATDVKGTTYSVVYDFIDTQNGHKQAVWSVDIATKHVTCVNEAAKFFSWSE
ncbi:MAG: hypothetical protein WB630_14145 [Candidatus Acidiferrales bacterium]